MINCTAAVLEDPVVEDPGMKTPPPTLALSLARDDDAVAAPTTAVRTSSVEIAADETTDDGTRIRDDVFWLGEDDALRAMNSVTTTCADTDPARTNDSNEISKRMTFRVPARPEQRPANSPPPAASPTAAPPARAAPTPSAPAAAQFRNNRSNVISPPLREPVDQVWVASSNAPHVYVVFSERSGAVSSAAVRQGKEAQSLAVSLDRELIGLSHRGVDAYSHTVNANRAT